MVEGGVTSKEHIDTPPFPVRSSWFRGYLLGNALWPQQSFGIRIGIFASVVADPPSRWEEFTQSEFTPRQVVIAGHALTTMHRQHGIPVATEWLATPLERPISEERVRDLWNTPRDTIAGLVQAYSIPVMPDMIRSDEDKERYRLIKGVMEHISSIIFGHSGEDISHLYCSTHTVGVDIREILGVDDMRRLTERYSLAIPDDPISMRTTFRSDIICRMEEIVRKNLQSTLGVTAENQFTWLAHLFA